MGKNKAMKISSFKKLERGVENSYLEYRMCKLEGIIEVFHFNHLVLQGRQCLCQGEPPSSRSHSESVCCV